MKRKKFVICVDNSAFPASLEKRKLYESIDDPEAKRHGQVRVIDESGDDYLYPAECFVDAQLSDKVCEALRGTA